ncbi:MAG: type II toxin-antitoxin system VapC family toxin [Chloroflexota bacterium]
MRLLLDTHVLLWWLADDPTLSPAARDPIGSRANVVAVSAATAWEISIKHALGKLVAPDDLEAQLDANNFQGLPITLANALAAGSLPRHHDDPFDRMLVAQARAGGFILVSRDPGLSRYDVELLTP